MVTRLKQDGDGFSLALDRPTVEKLQIDAGTPLEVTVEGDRLIVSAVKDPERRKEFERIVAEMNRRYDGMFKRLAE
jgi:antitoxin MazE